jgi:hypothetical protein
MNDKLFWFGCGLAGGLAFLLAIALAGWSV